MKEVTLLIPVYNVERYIGECAESLFGQTYPNLRFVFLNDCTPDGSIEALRKVVERFPERRESITILENERNRGIGYVRKRLLESVLTDFFSFVDSDDVLPPDAIEVLVKRQEETDADMVTGAYAEYFGGKQGQPILAYKGNKAAHLRRMLCQNIVSNRIWGSIYKSSVLEKVNDLFIEGINYTEDFCAMARLLPHITTATTDKVTYLYRTDNMTSYTKQTSRKNLLSYIRGCEVVLNEYKRRGKVTRALEAGMLNVYREPLRSGLNKEEIDGMFHFNPTSTIARWLFSWLRSGKKQGLADVAYKLFRRLVMLP